jgi:hypothetical protein
MFSLRGKHKERDMFNAVQSETHLTNWLTDWLTDSVEQSSWKADSFFVAQAVGRPRFGSEVRVRFQASACEICGRQNWDTRCSPSASVFPCQYHPYNAPYSYKVLSKCFSFPLSVSSQQCSILIQGSLQVLQFSSVSIIPTMLHTHSSVIDAV